MAQTILIVDDDPTQRRLMEAVVSKDGYRALTCDSGEAALDLLQGPKGSEIDLVILDLVMPGLDGMGVLDALKPSRPSLPVIVLTAHGGIDTVVNSMRAGADDFVVKPVAPERLYVSIRNALKVTALSGEISRLQRKTDGNLTFDDLVYNSAIMDKVARLGERAAASNIPILIDGESGVGKEVIARAIQGTGDRAGKPFVTVNCGAIPQNLVESILFGHEKGSFTGATGKHMGKFAEADSGTLFLDEIGELPLDMQVKLLRALQEGEIEPVGSKRPVKIDIRLISATNRDLSQMVQEGTFREDLFYRLNVFPIELPSLRERTEDIGPLVEHFLNRFAAEEGKVVKGIEPNALTTLQAFNWPGNVRQLENTIFRAVVLCDGDILTIEDFPQIINHLGPLPTSDTVEAAEGAASAVPQDTGEPWVGHAIGDIAAVDDHGEVRCLNEIEAEMIRFAIDKYSGHMSEVARRLGIGRSTLYRKIRDFDIDHHAIGG